MSLKCCTTCVGGCNRSLTDFDFGVLVELNGTKGYNYALNEVNMFRILHKDKLISEDDFKGMDCAARRYVYNIALHLQNLMYY